MISQSLAILLLHFLRDYLGSFCLSVYLSFCLSVCLSLTLSLFLSFCLSLALSLFLSEKARGVVHVLTPVQPHSTPEQGTRTGTGHMFVPVQ